VGFLEVNIEQTETRQSEKVNCHASLKRSQAICEELWRLRACQSCPWLRPFTFCVQFFPGEKALSAVEENHEGADSWKNKSFLEGESWWCISTMTT
jgi:hypothetical protein